MKKYLKISSKELKEKRIPLRASVYIVGLFLISVGILLIIGARVGLSGPDAYLTSIAILIGKDPNSEWYGYLIWIHYSILWLVIVAIRIIKKKIWKEKLKRIDFVYLLSMLAPVFTTGPIVSLNALWLASLLKNVNLLWIKYFIFIFGFIIAALGGACTIWTNFFIEPHSGLVLEVFSVISKKFNRIKFSYLRLCLDMIFFIFALIIGFSSKQFVFGFDPSEFSSNNFPLISYSTIIFVALNGFVFGMWLKTLNKILKKNKSVLNKEVKQEQEKMVV